MFTTEYCLLFIRYSDLLTIAPVVNQVSLGGIVSTGSRKLVQAGTPSTCTTVVTKDSLHLDAFVLRIKVTSIGVLEVYLHFL
jgi:hypothetical protein